MAIVFNDATLRTASLEVLNGPSTLTQLGNNTQNAVDGKADALLKDDANAVFYDNFDNIVRKYHDELQNLNGTVPTPYDENELVKAAKGQLGALHFPTSPPWLNFNPKLIDMVTGLPTSSTATNELQALSDVDDAITALLSGFNDGAVSDVLDSAWSGAAIEVSTGGFSPGQRAVVGVDTLVLINAVAPLLPSGQTLTVTVLAGTASAISGAPIATFRGGFNNTERSTGVTTSPSILAYFEGLLDAAIAFWDTVLAAELAALNLNDAEGAEATEIAQAIADVTSARAGIAVWQVAPQKYGDTQLGILQAIMTLRSVTQVPNRLSEIFAALGTVSQAGDGSFSGSGQYYQFFKWINQRIARAGGTLTKYYGYDLIVTFSTNIEDNKSGQITEYSQHIVVEALSADADGTDTVSLISSVEFSVSDTVSILDDTLTPTFSGTILAINGNDVQLSAPVSGFVTSSTARMTKVL